MLSLDNTYNFEEVKKFITKNPNTSYYITPKIDGIAVSLIYDKGVLLYGLSRDDGKTGLNITKNLILNAKNIPVKIKNKSLIEIRGELYICLSDFEKISEDYKSPRCAIWALLNKEPDGRKMLKFVAHSIGIHSPDIKTEEEAQRFFFLNGFQIPDFGKKSKTFETIKKLCQEFEKTRKKLNYNTDGVVIKVNEFDRQKELGETDHHPRWAIAYKFKPDRFKTTIKDIILQVGKTGRINPVAILEPIDCKDKTVQRLNLYNFGFIQSNDIRIGDMVLIDIMGGIIPAFVQCLKENRKGTEKIFIPPRGSCPFCGGPLEGDHNIKCVNMCGGKDKRNPNKKFEDLSLF